MRLSLKVKLTISYVLLSSLLVISFFVASNYFLEKRFQTYIIDTQEKKNLNIVNLVTNEFGVNGEIPNMDTLESIGNTALSQGLVLMVSDSYENEIICMSTIDSQMCNNMIESMQEHMASIYPNFDGKYVQKDYDITKNKTKVGTVTLGFYGPFYYNDEDINFLFVLNKLLIGISILSLFLAALLGYVMANRISKPIKKVVDKTKDLESGNYTDRLMVVSKTYEVNQLIHSVNSLADALERQLNSKKRMAKDYAHEFRTPLAVLQSNLEAMIDGVWEPTPERLESCREEILRLNRMILEIDKIVKIETENFKLHKTKFDLASIAEQVCLNFESDTVAKNIGFELNTEPCFLNADKDKIIQVLINLVTNAIKYTDNGGKIKISVKEVDKKAVIAVTDTGIGIAAEDLPNIFEYLYRTDKSRDRNTGGSGIGLSVVKAIVDAHCGTIVAKSEKSKGSEFIVTFPI